MYHFQQQSQPRLHKPFKLVKKHIGTKMCLWCVCVCVCVCVCMIEGEIILLVQSNGISHLLYPQLANLQLRHRLNHRLEIYVCERERERNREILNSEQSEVHMIGQYLAETTNLWSISGHRYTTKQLGILLALRTEAAVATLISPRYHLEGEIKERESELNQTKVMVL